jgi:hypothetical protein
LISIGISYGGHGAVEDGPIVQFAKGGLHPVLLTRTSS